MSCDPRMSFAPCSICEASRCSRARFVHTTIAGGGRAVSTALFVARTFRTALKVPSAPRAPAQISPWAGLLWEAR